MTHDCAKCLLSGKCTRHPKVKKAGVFWQICNNEGNPSIRAEWMAKWDIQEYGRPLDTERPKISGKSCCTQSPSIPQRLYNAGMAVVRWVTSGFRVAPRPEKERRKAICGNCLMNSDGWCQACGCHIDSKVAISSQSCPEGKWGEWHGDDEPPMGYLPTVEMIPESKKKRLVITVATGSDFARVLDLTGPFMRAYAERCDADFVALTDTTQNWPMYEKFRVHQWANRYKETLFIDADCLVRSDAENLFEMIPPNTVAMHNDISINRNNQWFIQSWAMVNSSQGVSRPLPVPLRVLNSGVVMCDQQTSVIWRPPDRPLPQTHEDEQIWIQSQIETQGIAVIELARGWNEQWYTQRTEDGNSPQRWEMLAEAAQIIHFARCPNRIPEIQRWIGKNRK